MTTEAPSLGGVTSADQAKLLFGALETMLSCSSLAFRRDCRPITFEMLSGGGIWSFVPGGGRALFVNADCRAAALRIYTVASVLSRLVFEPNFTLGADDPWFFVGDPTAFTPFVESLTSMASPLTMRVRQNTQTRT
jgi:hypothetical protein